MIKEVLVVEGKMDVLAVGRAVEADCIVTDGFRLSPRTLSSIRDAYKRRGVIILTDPDPAGERIRRYLSKKFPEAKHAFISKEDATANDDIGVEQASPEAIRVALEKVRTLDWHPVERFKAADLISARLSGGEMASVRRARLGVMLGVGCANAKTFLKRLNHYGVTREEFSAALSELDKEEANGTNDDAGDR